MDILRELNDQIPWDAKLYAVSEYKPAGVFVLTTSDSYPDVGSGEDIPVIKVGTDGESTYIEVAGTLSITDAGKYVLYPADDPYEIVLNDGDVIRAKALDGKHVTILGHLTPGRVIRVDSIQR